MFAEILRRNKLRIATIPHNDWSDLAGRIIPYFRLRQGQQQEEETENPIQTSPLFCGAFPSVTF
ncbi:MAG: hypothetical protein KGR46_10385 [Verrucomicrobia bacterium]|nr:hypothetical protein [Verrucomicrobiota bacterium]